MILEDEFVGDMSAEMVAHFFESIASAARVRIGMFSCHRPLDR